MTKSERIKAIIFCIMIIVISLLLCIPTKKPEYHRDHPINVLESLPSYGE